MSPAAGVPCELGVATGTGSLAAPGAEASEEDASPAWPPELGWLEEAGPRCGFPPPSADAAADDEADRPRVKEVAGEVEATMARRGVGTAAP